MNKPQRPKKALSPSSSAHNQAYDGHKNTLLQRLLPASADPYIRLLRLDRPIGTWLLAWPAFWGLGFAYHSDLALLSPTNGSTNQLWPPLIIFGLFLLGAFLMRSAGCVFNDIVDRKIDAQVARTKHRPIADGSILVKTALVILAVLLAGALLVLLQFNNLTIQLGAAILLPIALYPFMKRITYWPQAMLALCFSWGALMGWAALKDSLEWTAVLITLAAFMWTMGFDTIYAHQDKEDDAIISMKSTALKFGSSTKSWLAFFYTLTLTSLFIAGWFVGAKLLFFTFLCMASLHATWQITTLDINDPANCLTRFRSNGIFGLMIFIGIMTDLGFAYLLSP